MNSDASLSLFELLKAELGSRLPPIQATKATLVDVSHLLEDLVLSERLPAVICTGFQESSYWKAETERYREMAKIAHQICIFAGGTLPREDDQHQIHVTLRGPDALRQEWFLLVLTHKFSALLCGRDQLATVTEEADRLFATLWSFDPEMIAQVVPVLRDVVARERPDRLADLEDAFQRFPPVTPDARLLTLLTTQLIDDLGRQHHARIRLERTVAYDSRLRSLGQLISGVAHELNNPLHSILGFGSLLTADPLLPSAARTDIQHIVSAAERARAIVQNLLQLSRTNSESMTTLHLSDLIERTLVFVRADQEAAGVQLSVMIEQGLPPVTVNQVRIQQLLINLLTNALQALEEHAGSRMIQLSVKRAANGMVALIISDNGPGIPAQIHEHVFEPFFTTKPVGEGTGLGLSIVKTIVEEHHGTISLSSSPQAGTTFTILLPVGTGGHAMIDDAQPTQGQERILVIDDDPQVKVVVQRVLERAGYYVHAESSAQQALTVLAAESFDVIISDLMMPVVDGVSFYHRLLDQAPQLVQRLIFITGDATRPTIQAFLQQAMRPILIKPFLPIELLTTVRQIIESNS